MSIEINNLFIDIGKGLLRSPDAAKEIQMLEHWLRIYRTAPICGESFFRSFRKARKVFAKLTGNTYEFYGFNGNPSSCYLKIKEVYDNLNPVLPVVENRV